MTTSRYQGAPTYAVADPLRGDAVGLGLGYRVDFPSSFRLYQVQPGDRWDSLATRLLDDPGLWWKIADINPELFDPRALRPGITIRVP